MTTYYAPGALGQFSLGQARDAAIISSMTVDTASVAITTHTVSYGAGLTIGTMSVAVTGSMDMFVGQQLLFSAASVTVTANPVTLAFGRQFHIATAALPLALNDVTLTFARHPVLSVSSASLAVTLNPVRRALARSPLSTLTMGVTLRSTTLIYLPYGEQHYYLAPATMGQLAIGQGGNGDPENPTATSVSLTLNPVTLYFNGVPAGMRVLRPEPMHVVILMRPVTLSSVSYKRVTMGVERMSVTVTLNPVTLRSTHTYLSIETASVVITGTMSAVTPADAEIIDHVSLTAVASMMGYAYLLDNFTVASRAIQSCRSRATLDDGVSMADTQVYRLIASAANLEMINLAASVNISWPAALHDTATLTTVLDALRGVLLQDALRLTPTVVGQGVYNLTLADRLRVMSALGHFVGLDLHDNITLAASNSEEWSALIALSEAITVSDALAHYLLLRIDLADGIALTDDQALASLFDAALADHIAVTALHVTPSGSYTTWVVNTRSNNVTQYADWVFNSFAKMNGVYYGANETGIYELAGDTDDGVSIPAQIRSGKFQPGGSRLTALKCAYIGAMVTKDTRSTSRVYLKLITDNDEERVYQAMPLNHRTSRVNFGKGLRSRYYAWELATDDVDFDLDQIEFIPLVAKRRV